MKLEPNAALFHAAFTQSTLSPLLSATAYMTPGDLTGKPAGTKGNTTEYDSAGFSSEEDFKIYYKVSLGHSVFYVAEMNTQARWNCERGASIKGDSTITR